MQKKIRNSRSRLISRQTLYMYFHQIESVKFIYDSHGQTFLSTLYILKKKPTTGKNEKSLLPLANRRNHAFFPTFEKRSRRKTFHLSAETRGLWNFPAENEHSSVLLRARTFIEKIATEIYAPSEPWHFFLSAAALIQGEITRNW